MILLTRNNDPIAAYNNDNYDFNETFLRQRWSEVTLEPATDFVRQLSVMTLSNKKLTVKATNMRQFFPAGTDIVVVKMGSGWGYTVVTQDEAWRLPANLPSFHLEVK